MFFLYDDKPEARFLNFEEQRKCLRGSPERLGISIKTLPVPAHGNINYTKFLTSCKEYIGARFLRMMA